MFMNYLTAVVWNSVLFFFTLHGMLARTSDEKGVCPSVCLSNAWIVTKRKKNLYRFLYHTYTLQVFFVHCIMTLANCVVQVASCSAAVWWSVPRLGSQDTNTLLQVQHKSSVCRRRASE